MIDRGTKFASISEEALQVYSPFDINLVKTLKGRLYKQVSTSITWLT